MYDEIHRIPQSLMDDEWSLFIIPSVFLHKNTILRSCKGFQACIKRLDCSQILILGHFTFILIAKKKLRIV